MSQSKIIQRIEIPSNNPKGNDKSLKFNVWDFLTIKQDNKSICPVQGSLSFARETPKKFLFGLLSILTLLFLFSPINFFH